jgi:hypothetical protein
MPPRSGFIRAEKLGCYPSSKHRFVAVDDSNTTIAETAPFASAAIGSVYDGKRERAALRVLLTELSVLGWQYVETGGKWYEYRLFFVGEGKVHMPMSQREVRGGLSAGVMWGWSVVIVLALFFLCVLLVLTSEIQFGPA